MCGSVQIFTIILLLCRLHKKLNITHCWNFFDIGHVKGEHDDVGACVKRALQRYQMNPHADQFESVEQVVEWCKMTLSHEYNLSRDVRRCVYIYMLHMYT